MPASEKALCAAVFIHNGVTYRVTIRQHPGLLNMAERCDHSPRKRMTEAGGAIVIESLGKKA